MIYGPNTKWFYIKIYRNIEQSMMMSSNRNSFRITGSLWGEFTGHRWIPLTKTSDVELWCFLWPAPAKGLRKQSICQWVKKPSCSWRQCNALMILKKKTLYGLFTFFDVGIDKWIYFAAIWETYRLVFCSCLKVLKMSSLMTSYNAILSRGVRFLKVIFRWQTALKLRYS